MIGVMLYDSTVYYDDTSKNFTQTIADTRIVIDAKENIMKIMNLSTKPDYDPECKDCTYDFDVLYRFDKKGRLIMEYRTIFREGYFNGVVYDSAGNIYETYYNSLFFTEDEFSAFPADVPEKWPASHKNRFFYTDSGTLKKSTSYRLKEGKWNPDFTYFYKVTTSNNITSKTSIYEKYRKKGQTDETIITTYDNNKKLAYFKYELHSLRKGDISRTIKEWTYTLEKNKDIIKFEEWDIFDIRAKSKASIQETTVNFYDENQLLIEKNYLKVNYYGYPHVIKKNIEFYYVR